MRLLGHKFSEDDRHAVRDLVALLVFDFFEQAPAVHLVFPPTERSNDISLASHVFLVELVLLVYDVLKVKHVGLVLAPAAQDSQDYQDHKCHSEQAQSETQQKFVLEVEIDKPSEGRVVPGRRLLLLGLKSGSCVRRRNSRDISLANRVLTIRDSLVNGVELVKI